MAWVGLHDFIYILNPRSPARDPSQRRTQWGCVGDLGEEGGKHWARGAETFAHRPSERQTESSECYTL